MYGLVSFLQMHLLNTHIKSQTRYYLFKQIAVAIGPCEYAFRDGSTDKKIRIYACIGCCRPGSIRQYRRYTPWSRTRYMCSTTRHKLKSTGYTILYIERQQNKVYVYSVSTSKISFVTEIFALVFDACLRGTYS